MKQVTIAQNDANQRVDKFLTKTYPNLPQSMLYKAIRKKDIKVNGKRCEISTRLQEGDVLTMYLKDEFFAQAPKEYDFLKAPLKLNIIYEDENIMILDKKPGLIVHRTSIIILIRSLRACSTIFTKTGSMTRKRKILSPRRSSTA